jgi:hypothetical protein
MSTFKKFFIIKPFIKYRRIYNNLVKKKLALILTKSFSTSRSYRAEPVLLTVFSMTTTTPLSPLPFILAIGLISVIYGMIRVRVPLMPGDLTAILNLTELYIAAATDFNNIVIRALQQDHINIAQLTGFLPQLYQMITVQETLYERLI